MADDAGVASVIKISCGSSHSCALLDCNLVASWGRGEDGQLGHGDAEQRDRPKAIAALVDADVSSICCGAEYTVAVSDKHRRVYSWGWGDFGRLGHGDCSDVFVPQQIAFFNSMAIRQVACGDTHTLVCTEGGALFTFGRNQNGQLGLGDTVDVLAPQRVTELQDQVVVSVAGGAEHSVVATKNGEVYAFGWGRYGNLGDGERVDRHAPIRVHGLEGVHVSKVACGWRHSAAVTDNGRVFSWGWSKYGQLGLGDQNDRLIPAEVTALAGRVITTVAGGWRHTLAMDEGGTLFAWGWNKFGQLGLGHTRDEISPRVVEALAGQRAALLSCGWRHTLAVTAAGEVYAWGRGVNGQLGLGQEADESLPTRLTALCRGTASRQALLATAAAGAAGAAAGAVGGGGCAYVAPADRYAVVPEGDGDAEVPGAAAAADGAAAAGAVAAAAGGERADDALHSHLGNGAAAAAAAAGGQAAEPAAKKARLAAAPAQQLWQGQHSRSSSTAAVAAVASSRGD